MGCEYTNAKGMKYYLHGKGKIMFFSKDSAEAIDLPANYEIVESKRSGLPIPRKKANI